MDDFPFLLKRTYFKSEYRCGCLMGPCWSRKKTDSVSATVAWGLDGAGTRMNNIKLQS